MEFLGGGMIMEACPWAEGAASSSESAAARPESATSPSIFRRDLGNQRVALLLLLLLYSKFAPRLFRVFEGAWCKSTTTTNQVLAAAPQAARRVVPRLTKAIAHC